MNSTKWVIDTTHSEIAFKVKHLMISNVKGNFKQFEGSVSSDGDDFTNAEIFIKISPSSIDTGVADRDAHLKSPDFFDVENFTEITFISKNMVKIDDEEYKLTGDFKMKDTTKEITLDVEFLGIAKDPWGNTKAAFTLSTKINRKDWGLNWNAALEAGGVLVSEEVKLSADIQLLKTA